MLRTTRKDSVRNISTQSKEISAQKERALPGNVWMKSFLASSLPSKLPS
jgi:hypothetical protein